MVLYGGLAVAATGGSTMHATSPTKAGESYTITYSRNVQLFIVYHVKPFSRRCVAMSRKCTIIFYNGITLEKREYIVFSLLCQKVNTINVRKILRIRV